MASSNLALLYTHDARVYLGIARAVVVVVVVVAVVIVVCCEENARRRLA